MSCYKEYEEWIKENSSKVKKDIVIIAYDVDKDNPEIRNELRNYIEEDLKGIRRTESVYEFDTTNDEIDGKKIVSKIRGIINEKSDTVYIWFFYLDKDREINRLKIGK
ncbi:MAG: hypothetical protein PF638_16245 [Candidatus Delongbacteria bacterium]|jgi:CRISPR/Cas system-associated endoribonuclease Cas2|nr:hypothetical protein [Candidatus Delongbacteria bacterium]